MRLDLDRRGPLILAKIPFNTVVVVGSAHPILLFYKARKFYLKYLEYKVF